MHAAGVVDEVGVDATALAIATIERVFDAPELRAAQISAFANNLAAQRAAVDADRVVGAIAAIIVRLQMTLHIGADAAVPQQIDRRTQNRAHQLLRRDATVFACQRSEEHTSELQSLMRISYAVYCLKK